MNHDSPETFKGVALVTPSDTANFTDSSRAIRATGAGNIRVLTVLGQDVVCAFTAGETRNIQAWRIFSTNTTATGIEIMW